MAELINKKDAIKQIKSISHATQEEILCKYVAVDRIRKLPTTTEAEIKKKAYNMAIDDFTERLRKKCDSVIREEWNHNVQPASWADAYEDFKDDIDEIAESLKIVCILEQSS